MFGYHHYLIHWVRIGNSWEKKEEFETDAFYCPKSPPVRTLAFVTNHLCTWPTWVFQKAGAQSQSHHSPSLKEAADGKRVKNTTLLYFRKRWMVWWPDGWMNSSKDAITSLQTSVSLWSFELIGYRIYLSFASLIDKGVESVSTQLTLEEAAEGDKCTRWSQPTAHCLPNSSFMIFNPSTTKDMRMSQTVLKGAL